jgi:hypothetical protein
VLKVAEFTAEEFNSLQFLVSSIDGSAHTFSTSSGLPQGYEKSLSQVQLYFERSHQDVVDKVTFARIGELVDATFASTLFTPAPEPEPVHAESDAGDSLAVEQEDASAEILDSLEEDVPVSKDKEFKSAGGKREGYRGRGRGGRGGYRGGRGGSSEGGRGGYRGGRGGHEHRGGRGGRKEYVKKSADGDMH